MADDIHPQHSDITDEMWVKIDEIISANRDVPGAVITVLRECQDVVGYLPIELIDYISYGINLSRSEVFGVASFYALFSFVPKGRHLIKVCMGTACHVRGSPRILDRLKTQLGIEAGETTRNCLFTLETVNCLGACALGPIIVADGEYAGQMTLQRTDRLLKHLKRTDASHG